MAKKSRPSAPTEWKPPTPKQRRDESIERAAKDAVLAHPQTQKLQRQIESRMKAAASGRPGAGRVRSA